jgi:hypothetical protein
MRRWSALWMIVSAAMVLMLAAMIGCKGNPKPPAIAAEPGEQPQTPEIRIEDLPSMNDAREAAMTIAAMPLLTDLRTQMELLLQAELYRAAFRTRRDTSRNFCVLEPANDPYPVGKVIDDREFRLRILAELMDLDVPLAWVLPRNRNQPEKFPGTDQFATRLGIRIIRRQPEIATVHAEVSNWTADAGGSRLLMQASWNGQSWDLQPEGVRVFW